MATNAATEAALGSLHATLATVLTQALTAEGGAPAAVLAVAAKFLKDNSISCVVDKENGMGELQRALDEATAPETPAGLSDLQDALNSVVDLQEYRNGTA